jgi:hypothetical protein
MTLACQTVGNENDYDTTMATTPSNNSILKRLIREAGYSYQTVDRQRVELLFGGPYRPWTVILTLDQHWLNLWVYVCGLPEAPGQRAELAEQLMHLNAQHVLAKYSFHHSDVILELQYRHEHLNSDSMTGVVSLLTSIADADYPRIVRLLSGDATLERLERSFKSQAPAGEAP